MRCDRPAGEQFELNLGDQVEIYRKSPYKDRPQWVGPATVVNLEDSRHGQVSVRWQGRVIDVSTESIRRAMVLFSGFYLYGFDLDNTDYQPCLRTMLRAFESIRTCARVLGHHYDRGTWRLTGPTRGLRHSYFAARHAAVRHLGLRN